MATIICPGCKEEINTANKNYPYCDLKVEETAEARELIDGLKRKRKMNILFKVIGFAIGFGMGGFVDYAILELGKELLNRHIRLGLSAVLLPLLGGYLIASMMSYDGIKSYLGGKKIERRHRLIIAGIFSWLIIVAGYIFLAEPFGNNISSREWKNLLTWLIIPPGIFVIIFAVFRWAAKEPR